MASVRNVLLLTLAGGLGVGAFLFARMDVLGEPTEDGSHVTVVARDVAVADGSRPANAPGSGIELVDPGANKDRAESGPGDARTTVIYPLVVEASLMLPGSVTVPDGAMPFRSGNNAGIEGNILGSDGRPASATISFLHGPNEGRVLTTDSRGRYGANDLLPGRTVVRIQTASGSAVEREVRLTQLSVKPYGLSFAHPSTVSGTVKSEKGKELEGAEVYLDGRLTFTDGDGRFTYLGVPAGKVWVTTKKPGFATTRRSVGVGLGATVVASDFQIVMGPPASLEIGFKRPLGTADPSIAILTPSEGSVVGLAERAFPWHEVNPVRVPAVGSVIVEGLPDTSVTVHVFHPSGIAVPRSRNVRLYGGKKGRLMVELQPVPRIRGQVTLGGKAAAGVTIKAEPADQGGAMSRAMGLRNPRQLSEVIVPPLPVTGHDLKTDAKGQFSFPLHPDVVADYYVTATSKDGQHKGVGVVRPGESQVAIQLEPVRDDRGAIEIALPGRFQGLPVELRIQGEPQEPRVLRPGLPLRLEGLEYGVWRLRARWRGDEVLYGTDVEVGPTDAQVRGELPSGAIQGQTEAERQRAGAAVTR